MRGPDAPEEHRPDLDEFFEQMGQIEKLGPLDQVLSMIPGAFIFWGHPPETAKGFRKSKTILEAMTSLQRKNPSLIDASQLQEIAERSGVTLSDVNGLLSQYWEMRGR